MVIPVSAVADSNTISLGSAVNGAGVSTAGPIATHAEALIQRRRRRASTSVNPIAIRLGAAAGDNGGLLIGFDVGLPSFSIGQGWSGRLDFDFWGFGKDNTNAAIIVDQIMSSDGQVYLGFGIGVVTGSDGSLGIKFLIGTTLTDTLDLEFDVILHDDVSPAIVFRIKV
jgi:hypothetical protein